MSVKTALKLELFIVEWDIFDLTECFLSNSSVSPVSFKQP